LRSRQDRESSLQLTSADDDDSPALTASMQPDPPTYKHVNGSAIERS
jgi:hypothetical protein